MNQRLLVQLKEKGFEHGLATLGISVVGNVPYQALRLIENLNSVKSLEWFTELTSSALRVKNILQKNSSDEINNEPDESLMTVQAERDLLSEINRLESHVKESVKYYDWANLTQSLAELSPVVSQFFDDVMVMDKDLKIRNNRLALLNKCNNLFREVGDLSVLS